MGGACCMYIAFWRVVWPAQHQFGGSTNARAIAETAFIAGVQIPQLEYGAPDYEQYGEVCGSEGPDGGEWAC